jgi:hypothetical protein
MIALINKNGIAYLSNCLPHLMIIAISLLSISRLTVSALLPISDSIGSKHLIELIRVITYYLSY